MGKFTLSNVNYRDITPYTAITSFEKACFKLRLDHTILPNVDSIPEPLASSIIAYYKLSIIYKAVNGGWQPNYTKPHERKHFGYWERGKSTWTTTRTHACHGKLVTFDAEKALFLLDQFPELHAQFWQVPYFKPRPVSQEQTQ